MYLKLKSDLIVKKKKKNLEKTMYLKLKSELKAKKKTSL